MGIGLASTVIALGSYRVITNVRSDFGSGGGSAGSAQRIKVNPSDEIVGTASSGPRKAAEPHSPRKSDRRRALLRLAQSGYFGWSRSRSPYYSYRDDDPEDDEDDAARTERWTRHARSGGYRTLCVRLCDGYYFPISFSASRDRFGRDAKACERACPGQARLFFHPSSAGDVDGMVDLSGKPYRELNTAFLYRDQLVPSCRCKPEPWEPEARLKHRMYALEAAARKGDKQAASQLAELAARAPAERQSPSPRLAAPAEEQRTQAPERTGRMGLGAARGQREGREPPRRSEGRETDWMSRALGRPL